MNATELSDQNVWDIDNVWEKFMNTVQDVSKKSETLDALASKEYGALTKHNEWKYPKEILLASTEEKRNLSYTNACVAIPVNVLHSLLNANFPDP